MAAGMRCMAEASSDPGRLGSGGVQHIGFIPREDVRRRIAVSHVACRTIPEQLILHLCELTRVVAHLPD